MKKVIIVGGGVSGLTAGIFLRLKGFECDIYEKSSIVGGNLTGWKRDGYVIDNCTHWLTGTNPATKLYKLWKDVGMFDGVATYQADNLFTSVMGDEEIPLSLCPDFTLKKMINLSNEDKKEATKFISAVKSLQKSMGISGNNHDSPTNIFKKINSIIKCRKYATMSLYDLSNKFSHPLIKKFFTDYIPGEFSALALICVFATFSGENGGLLEGGSIKMAERIKNKFLSLGGNIFTNKECVKVNIKNKAITSAEFEDGTISTADYFIFASDIFTTYNKLLNIPLPKKILKWENNKYAYRFSSFHSAISVDGEVPFKNTVILDVPIKYRKVLGEDRFKVKEYSYDKSFAPEGKNILQTIQFIDKINSKQWIWLREDKYRYNMEKQKICSIYIKILEEYYPSLKGKISVIDCWTPATYKRYFGAENGEYMSYILPKSTIPYTLKSKIKNVNNGAICTQWQSCIGGLPNALKFGKKTANYIYKLNKANDIKLLRRIFFKLEPPKNL